MQLVLSRDAKKQFDKLPIPEQEKIKKRLHALILSPLMGKKLSGEFLNQRSLRAWPYRIVYFINQKDKVIEVNSILHRQGVYK